MEVVFEDRGLEEVDAGSKSLSLGEGIDEKFRQRIDYIRAAIDERDFYKMKSLHFEKLEGRDEDRSLRINKQWRLIVRLEGDAPNKRVRIVGIEDYH